MQAATVELNDRPIESVRQQVVDRLIANYSLGHISLEAFERRLDEAMDSNSNQELMALVEDLPGVDPSVEKAKPAYDSSQHKDAEHIINIFSGSNKAGVWPVARNTRMVNVFGGGEIDYTYAVFVEPKTTISLFCMFGGAEIYVPAGANVVNNSLCLFGGMHNKVDTNYDPDRPTIVINGLILFGGASVKVKVSMKERMLKMAEAIKRKMRG